MLDNYSGSHFALSDSTSLIGLLHEIISFEEAAVRAPSAGLWWHSLYAFYPERL